MQACGLFELDGVSDRKDSFITRCSENISPISCAKPRIAPKSVFDCSRIGGLTQYMLSTASKYLVGSSYSIISLRIWKTISWCRLFKTQIHLRTAQLRWRFSCFCRSTPCTCVMPVLWRRPLTWLSAWCPNTLKRPSSSAPCTPSLWSPFFSVLLRYLRYSADGSVISTTSDSYTQRHIKWLRVTTCDTFSASFYWAHG